MSPSSLAAFVAETATTLGIPGVAVGVWDGERETVACHGVTSVDNPLPVNDDTLFLLGSVTKTFTATAVMRLSLTSASNSTRVYRWRRRA